MTQFGFQLYSARNFQPFSAIFPQLKEAGYTHVEGYGAMYTALDDDGLNALRADLDSNGLTMPTGHFGLDLIEGDPLRVLKIARLLGIEAVYCPYLMPDMRPKDAGSWFSFGQRLQEAGKAIRDAGLIFGWHNHDFEFATLEDGSTAQEQILAGGPELAWEADIAWIIRGGADPFAWIESYGKRITAVHVKDIAAPGTNTDEDGWADVGQGTVPWKDLMAALRAYGVRHYILEHDNPKDVGRLITRSIAAFNTY